MLYLAPHPSGSPHNSVFIPRGACIEDNEACFEWFGESLDDLENDTVKLLFRYGMELYEGMRVEVRRVRERVRVRRVGVRKSEGWSEKEWE